MLKDRIVSSINQIKESRNYGLHDSAAAISEIKELVGDIKNQTIKQRVDALTSFITRIENDKKKLMDEKKQASRADYSERLRYLTFRFLTAASIAAVVLATGWTAKVLEIPLPLLRIAT